MRRTGSHFAGSRVAPSCGRCGTAPDPGVFCPECWQREFGSSSRVAVFYGLTGFQACDNFVSGRGISIR